MANFKNFSLGDIVIVNSSGLPVDGAVGAVVGLDVSSLGQHRWIKVEIPIRNAGQREPSQWCINRDYLRHFSPLEALALCEEIFVRD